MKRAIESYLNLSRRERMAYASVTIIMMVMLIVYAVVSLMAKAPATNTEVDKRLAAEWNAFKSRQIAQGGNNGEGSTDGMAVPLFPFDPNTLDSVGFIRLGMNARAVKGLMNWRRHGKHFYKRDDLKPLYNLTPEEYARLEPYISIDGTGDEHKPFERGNWSSNYPPVPTVIDINTTDTTTLDRGIRGIGATLARKILARRNALGGYLTFEQITEGFRLPDSTVAALREKVRIDPARVRKLSLNTVSIEQLVTHPYIGEKIAKGIIQLRGGYGKYTAIEQLRQAPLMTEEIYRKIAPYFTLE